MATLTVTAKTDYRFSLPFGDIDAITFDFNG